MNEYANARTPGRGIRLAALAAVLAVAGGCFDDKGILEVRNPDVITPENVADAAGAEALRVAAVGRLAITLSGTQTGATGLIPVSGTLADEFMLTSARAGLAAVDGRIVDEQNEETYVTSQFQRLHQTRLAARSAIDALQAYAPDSSSDAGQMYGVLGYAELLLAEHFCSGIPLSEVVDGRPVYGEALTTEEVYARALAHFDTAQTFTDGDARIAHMVSIGRARTLLDLGRFGDADAAVDAVPTDYVYNLEFSASDRTLYNGVSVWINRGKIYGVADREGTNGLDYRSAGDPRVQVADAGPGQDGETPAWVPLKYASVGAPIVLADGVEARLIQAEAKLRAGDADGALAILNDLRARVAGLEPLADAGSPAARVDQLFRERAFWMFATAHRLGDMRRLVRQYGRDQATVFPVGPYFRGGEYGSEVTLPIPTQEGNNPNATGCLDREA